MELKKVIKTILIGGGIALLGFSTFKACKNNDFSAVKTLTKETRINTRAERINAPKRAISYSWDNINSWDELNGITLTFKGTDTGSGNSSFNLYTKSDDTNLINVNGVNYTTYSGASGSMTFYYSNNIIRFTGKNVSTGNVGSFTLNSGDKVIFNVNNTSVFSTIKTILINSFDLPEPITATLELDLTNLTNFDLDAIYLDNNTFPLSSNIIDLTTLTDGEHTLTFYDAQNDNCFNSSISYSYYGFGTGTGSLFNPLSSSSWRNNSEYRGQYVFTWDSSLLTVNKTYKITLSGHASYNFNYLTGKSYILNAELPYLKQAGERWWLDAKDTETTYFVYNYSNSSLAVKAIARTEGVDAIHGNYLIFGNNQDSSLIFGEYPIYAHQINSYENEYGVPPRLISFLSTFNNDNMNNFYYSYNGAVANIVGDYMYSANIVDYLIANSTELSTEQIETYESGYNAGYQEGLRYSSSLSNLIYNFFKGIDDALSIEIIPNVQLKYIIYIPLVLSIVRFILGWFK